jgi:hypothetical protein
MAKAISALLVACLATLGECFMPSRSWHVSSSPGSKFCLGQGRTMRHFANTASIGTERHNLRGYQRSGARTIRAMIIVEEEDR